MTTPAQCRTASLSAIDASERNVSRSAGSRLVLEDEAARSALRNELLQLEHVVADCRDFEEPVPARVRRRLAAVRRELRAEVSA